MERSPAWSPSSLGIVIVLVTVWNVFTALVVPRVTSSRVSAAWPG